MNNEYLKCNFNYIIREDYKIIIIIYPLDYEEIKKNYYNYFRGNDNYFTIDKQFIKYLKNIRKICFHYSFRNSNTDIYIPSLVKNIENIPDKYCKNLPRNLNILNIYYMNTNKNCYFPNKIKKIIFNFSYFKEKNKKNISFVDFLNSSIKKLFFIGDGCFSFNKFSKNVYNLPNKIVHINRNSNVYNNKFKKLPFKIKNFFHRIKFNQNKKNNFNLLEKINIKNLKNINKININIPVNTKISFLRKKSKIKEIKIDYTKHSIKNRKKVKINIFHFPNTLKIISFSVFINLKSKFNINYLPNSLNNMYFVQDIKINEYYKNKDMFKMFVDNLPNKMIKIRFARFFNNKVNKMPSKLKSIIFGYGFEQNIQKLFKLKNLEYINIGKCSDKYKNNNFIGKPYNIFLNKDIQWN